VNLQHGSPLAVRRRSAEAIHRTATKVRDARRPEPVLCVQRAECPLDAARACCFGWSRARPSHLLAGFGLATPGGQGFWAAGGYCQEGAALLRFLNCALESSHQIIPWRSGAYVQSCHGSADLQEQSVLLKAPDRQSKQGMVIVVLHTGTHSRCKR